MMNLHLQQLSCLAIIKAFPGMIKGDELKQGRLRNLNKQLSVRTDAVIHGHSMPSLIEMKQMQERITKWMDMTGWENKKKHVCTLVSFLVGITTDYMPLERKLAGLLSKIYIYFERAGKAPVACAVGGCTAMKKWNLIFDKI